MALQLGILRGVLIEAGADPARAGEAAAEVGAYENRLASVETRLAVLLVMVTGLYAIALPGAWLLLRIASKLGALG